MTGKKTLLKLFFAILGLVFILSPLALLNYYLDPFHALRNGNDHFIIEPNFHALKVIQVLSHPKNYSSFLFGSSRGMQFKPSWVGPKGFNNAYPGGTPQEFLGDLQIYLAHGVQISTVYLLVDDLSYTTLKGMFEEDLNKKPYPTNPWKAVDYWIKYLLKVPSYHLLIRYKQGYDKKELARFISSDPVDHDWNAQIEADPSKHRQNPKFKQGYPSPSIDEVDDTIDCLKQIRDLAIENHFTLTVLINPIYERTFKNFNLPLFKKFTTQLASFLDFYSFLAVREITQDPYNYFEPSHFRSNLANDMLKTIRHEPLEKNIKDPLWGKVITKDNISEYLSEIEKRYNQPLE